jgi:hypothetical protein
MVRGQPRRWGEGCGWWVVVVAVAVVGEVLDLRSI